MAEILGQWLSRSLLAVLMAVGSAAAQWTPSITLKPGEYPFFGEFNMKTALGKIIAE